MAKQRSLHLEVIILEIIATSVIFKWDIHRNIYMITYLYASVLICTRINVNIDVYMTPEIVPTTFDTRLDPTNRYICIYVYLHIHVCTYAHINTNICIYIHVYIWTYRDADWAGLVPRGQHKRHNSNNDHRSQITNLRNTEQGIIPSVEEKNDWIQKRRDNHPDLSVGRAMYLYLYTYICIYIYTFIYKYIYQCICMCINAFICMYM
jgi:hypothetical protein